ncbi:hypothetical protein PCANC_26726, partial [Puccinia coronata f. sp. avenae]
VMTPESLLVDPLNDTLPSAIFPDEAELPLSEQEVTPVDTEVPSAESGLPWASSHHPQMPMQSPNPGSTSCSPKVVPVSSRRRGRTEEIKSDANITSSVLLLMKASQDTMAKWMVEEKSWIKTSRQEEQAQACQLEETRQQDKDLKQAKLEIKRDQAKAEQKARNDECRDNLPEERKEQEANQKAQETSWQLFESTMLTLLGKLASK